MRNPRSASRVLLVVTVLLSLLLATALPASAMPWQWADPLPTGAELHGVAFGNNRFVAVGDAGTLLTSPDGITWTTGKTGTDLTLQAVAYGNGAFVAVAGEPLPDRWAILSSPDGLTWQQACFPALPLPMRT